MDKTTIYLPTELKSAIKRVARRRGVSEAEVIRESIRAAVGDDRPRPRGGLFASRSPIAREADEHLPGFGERSSSTPARSSRSSTPTSPIMGLFPRF